MQLTKTQLGRGVGGVRCRRQFRCRHFLTKNEVYCIKLSMRSSVFLLLLLVCGGLVASAVADEVGRLARKARKKEMMRQMANEVNAAIHTRKAVDQRWDARHEVAQAEETALMAARSVNHRRQLILFYEEHNPAKIATVDKLLEDFTHEAIAASLQKVYGQLPTGWSLSDHRAPPEATRHNSSGDGSTRQHHISTPQTTCM
jgi:hypothetical protein